MIFSSRDDLGKKVSLPDGIDAVISSVSIPPPVSEGALGRHLRKGAVLVHIVDEPPVFADDGFYAPLETMKAYNTQVNQRMLVVVGEEGESRREIYADILRGWIERGGVSYYAHGIEEIGNLKPVQVQEATLATVLTSLPGIAPERAERIALLGPRAFSFLTTRFEPEKVLATSAFEGLTLADLHEIWNALEVQEGERLALIKERDISIVDLVKFANENGGVLTEEE